MPNQPRGAAIKFTDPDDFAASIQDYTAHIQLLDSLRNFVATIRYCTLHGLCLQQGSERCARVGHATSASGRISLAFLANDSKDSPLAGLSDASNALWLHGPGHAFVRHVNGPINWCTISLPTEDFTEAIWTQAGKEVALAQGACGRFHTDHSALEHLRNLHVTALELAQQSPQVLADRHVTSGLERALVNAMVTCVTGAIDPLMSPGERRHRQVIDRFEATLARMPVEPLYLSDICTAIGVSARTMEYCCREYYGMGPNRYLRLRRMNMARRALIDAAPDETSVTDVAMRFGFWELGRFASAYRILFDETPSATLRRVSGIDGARKPVGVSLGQPEDAVLPAESA